MVLTIGGEFGTVGWVDLWRGILMYDLFLDNNSLRYVPLPLPLVPVTRKGNPIYSRNIIVIEDYIKFVEMVYIIRPGSNTRGTCFAAAQGLVLQQRK